MLTRGLDPESAEYASDREEDPLHLAYDPDDFGPPLTHGLDPESPEYAGAAEEERWVLRCEIEEQLQSYIEETKAAVLERHGTLPDEGHGIEDIEKRMARYRNDPRASESYRWRPDDFEIALGVLAPAQRQDLLARGHQSDLSHASPDHSLGARSRSQQDVGLQRTHPMEEQVTHGPQLLGEPDVSARLQSALERAREQVRRASRSCALAGGPRIPDEATASETRRLEAPGSLDGPLLGSHEAACRELNSALRQVRNLIHTNPLYQDANLRLESSPVAALDAYNDRLQTATARLTKSEHDFNLAYDQLESWNGRPAWRRTIQDGLFRSGRTIEQNYERARCQLADERLTFTRAVNEAHREIRQQDEQLEGKRELARHWRSELEAPLRAVRLEQSIVRDILARGQDIQPLEAAATHEPIVFSGRRTESFGEVYEFRSSHTLYRADAITLGTPPLVPGDKLRLVSESGQRRLMQAEPSPPIERPRSHGLGR